MSMPPRSLKPTTTADETRSLGRSTRNPARSIRPWDGDSRGLRRRAYRAGGALLLGLLASCATLEEATRAAAGASVQEAVDTAVQARMADWVAGFTAPMLFQIAYTQVFYLGGFGVGVDDFAEGEGATWRLESIYDGETTTVTAERALLERLDDGTSWWYLRYAIPDEPPLEFEVRLAADLQAREMYLRDPETGDVRHHEFAYDPEQETDLQESREELEAAGYYTGYAHLEDWAEFREDRVSIQVGAGTFETDLLVFRPPDDEEERYQFRWWVTEEVPGHLVRFQYDDLVDDGELRGELVERRDDYQRRLSN